MDKNRILKILAIYRAYFEEKGIGQAVCWELRIFPIRMEILMDCHNDLGMIEHLIEEGNIEEANLALGKVQGCLFSEAVYTKKELREHNSL